MKVTRLKLTNLRALKTAEFQFKPGFNLIVGVNGVGKTTVIDALAVCLAAVVKQANKLRSQSESFSVSDIRLGSDSLTVECGMHIGGAEFVYLVHKNHSSSLPQEKMAGMPREEVYVASEKSEFLGDVPPIASGKEEEGRPLGVAFFTRRAVTFKGAATKGASAGGIVTAYHDALSNRELRLEEFAHWMRVQNELKSERPAIPRILDSFQNAVRRFLPGYSGIDVNDSDDPELIISCGESKTLYVEELPDQDRSKVAEAMKWTDNRMALEWAGKVATKNRTVADEVKAYSAAKGEIIAQSLKRYLPAYTNLRTDSEGRRLIDREPFKLPVRQLSDGERGVLAIVLDLTRRLVQANPDMIDPAAQAEAVVLIDEIDLHLHPKWQRQIVQNLTETFPKCQFIATSHSPFVVQSLRPGALINLDSEGVQEYADKSIEDIVENVMGVPLPQKSLRFLRMMEVASEYYSVLNQASNSQGARLAKLKELLDELSVAYSDDPAFVAYLEFQRGRELGAAQ